MPLWKQNHRDSGGSHKTFEDPYERRNPESRKNLETRPLPSLQSSIYEMSITDCMKAEEATLALVYTYNACTFRVPRSFKYFPVENQGVGIYH